MDDTVDEKRVEIAYRELDRLRHLVWSLPLPDAAALAERVHVELMIDKTLQGPLKRFYRAFSDYLDDVVDDRSETENRPRESFHQHVVDYVRGVLGADDER
jgi:hypothetical protein